jgi:hypothetical protein
MGKARSRRATSPGVTLDAGALIALDRGDRRMIALLDAMAKRRLSFQIPTGVVGQAWRDGSRQATLARFLSSEGVRIVALDDQLSRACGALCGHSRTADVIDASVVLVARGRGDTIVTSDAGELRRLDPSCHLVEV